MIKNQALTKALTGNRAFLGLALLFGLIFAVLVYVYLNQVGEDDGVGGQISGETRSVVVANQDIPAGIRLAPEMVRLEAIPSSLVLSNVFDTVEGTVGQVTTLPLVAGEQVLSSRISSSGVDLTQFGDDLPVSLVIPAGMRAFSVRTSEVSAVGGLVRPGDYVDVILSGELPIGSAETPDTVGAACYIVQDVQVLAVSQAVTNPTGATSSAAPSGEEGSGPALADTEANPEAASATLAVNPQQAWALAAAQRSVNEKNVSSQLWLSLRPYAERGETPGLPVCTVLPGS